MTFVPKAIVIDETGGYPMLHVLIHDDPDDGGHGLLIPCSWAHRRVVDPAEIAAMNAAGQLNYDPAAYQPPEPAAVPDREVEDLDA